MGLISTLYKDSRTVFRFRDISMIMNEINFDLLKLKLHYYVRTGQLLNPRKGFYAKENYKPEELACLLYPPTYISLEYVLQRAGVIFQYDSAITNVSYLTRKVEIEGQTFCYRKIKGEILVNTEGIILNTNNINIATPERAFLDMLYLNKDFYFDNLHILNTKKIIRLLPLYNSQTLEKRALTLFKNDKYR